VASVALGRLYQRARYILRHEGRRAFFRQGLAFVGSVLFSYGHYYIYEKELGEPSETKFTLRTPDRALRIVATTDELEELVVEGFDVDSYFDMEELRWRIEKGMTLFCVFVGKDLAHRSLVAMARNANVDPVLSRYIMNWQQEASIGPCTTLAEYSGQNLYPYTLSQICKYLKGQNRRSVKITASRQNASSIRGIEKAGFTICGEAHYLRLFYLMNCCKVRPI